MTLKYYDVYYRSFEPNGLNQICLKADAAEIHCGHLVLLRGIPPEEDTPRDRSLLREVARFNPQQWVYYTFRALTEKDFERVTAYERDLDRVKEQSEKKEEELNKELD